MLKENMDAINKMSDVKDALFYRELNAKLIRENRELKAENKRLNDCSDAIFVEILERGHKKEIRELKAEISQLKADNISLFKRLNDANKQTIRERVKHYPKEYKAEAREYFDNNPQCKSLLFFVIDGNEFDKDGCYNAYLLDDECIAKIDNS